MSNSLYGGMLEIGTSIWVSSVYKIASGVITPLFSDDLSDLAIDATGTPTRASTAYHQQPDGAWVPVLSGETRWDNARRVHNFVIKPETWSGTPWANSNITVATGVADPDGGTSAITLTADANAAHIYQQIIFNGIFDGHGSLWIRRRTGTGTIDLNGSDWVNRTAQVSTTWQRLVLLPTGVVPSSWFGVRLGTIGDAVDVWHPLFEWAVEVSLVYTAPSEYVSNNVLSAPYHGANVDGVKYFDYENGNTIDANGVVTEAQGAALTGPFGYLMEPAAINYLLNSAVPATQTTGSLATGTYCLWVEGTGSAAPSAGTATITGEGTASAGSPDVFEVTGAGTVTVTVTGTLTKFQLEKVAVPSSFILTAGSTVARAVDALSYSGISAPNESRIVTSAGTTDIDDWDGVLPAPTEPVVIYSVAEYTTGERPA